MNCLENKRYIYTYSTTPECLFSHPDLLVFSFLGFQDRYCNNWTYRQIAKRTGLTEETASASVQRLSEFGLITTDRKLLIPEEMEDWFIWKKMSKPTDHFSLRLAGFNNYTRHPSSPLTPIQHSLFSYLLSCKAGAWQPAKGFTVAYLAEVLCSTVSTIKEAVEKLEKYCFIKTIDGQWGLYKSLHYEQLQFFMDHAEHSASGRIVELDEEPPLAAISNIFDEIERKENPVRNPLSARIEKYLDDHLEGLEYYPDLPVKVFEWFSSHPATNGTTEKKIELALKDILKK